MQLVLVEGAMTGKVTGSTGESNGATSTKVSSGEEVQFQAGNNLIVDQKW